MAERGLQVIRPRSTQHLPPFCTHSPRSSQILQPHPFRLRVQEDGQAATVTECGTSGH